MATYGIRITPDDGGKQIILDGSMRYASYLGTADLYSAGTGVQLSRPQRSNSKALIVPRRTLSIAPAQTNPSGPGMKWATSINFDGSSVSCQSDKRNANDNNTVLGSVDVFSVQYAESTNTYGVRIVNGSNFMEISDAGYAGYVTWRGVVNIDGWWPIPQEVVNMGPYVVFARWSNSDTPLFLDRDGNGISTWGGFGNNNGSTQGGLVAGIQIVIVSCGVQPSLPASGYGLVIRNASNQITYSSKYPPVMWPDAYYNFPYYYQGDDGGGDYNQWIGPTGNISNPMVPLCTLGFQRGDFNRNSNNYNFRKCLYSGLKMVGNSVTTARAKTTGSDMEVLQYPKAVQVACQLPCIEASYYF